VETANDNVERLVDACERALGHRGVVMFECQGEERCWTAVCVNMDRSIELRVGEPSRGWRRWQPAPGETWLREHGFQHRAGAWSLPVAYGATPRTCADLMLAALRDGLGMPNDGVLVERLVHPGLISTAPGPPPPADAPHVEHIAHALESLAAHGRGKLSVEGGRPVETWAWVFVTNKGQLELSPEPPGDPGEYERDWWVDPGQDLRAEAVKLTAILHDELGRSPADPILVTFMDL